MAKAKKKVIKKITKKPEVQQAVQQQNVQSMQTTQQQQQQIKLVANNQFCSIIHSSFFNETQCNALVKSLVEELWTTGKTVGGGVVITGFTVKGIGVDVQPPTISLMVTL